MLSFSTMLYFSNSVATCFKKKQLVQFQNLKDIVLTNNIPDVSKLIGNFSGVIYISEDTFNKLVMDNLHQMVHFLLSYGYPSKVCTVISLEKAVFDNYSEIVIALLQYGILQDRRPTSDNFIESVRQNNVHTVIAFLRAGVDPKSCSFYILDQAIFNNHVEMVNVLIRASYLDQTAIPNYCKLIADILKLDPTLAAFLFQREIDRKKRNSWCTDDKRSTVMDIILYKRNILAIDNLVKISGRARVFEYFSPDIVRELIHLSKDVEFIHRLISLGLYMPRYFSQKDFEYLCKPLTPIIDNNFDRVIELLVIGGSYSTTKLSCDVFEQLIEKQQFVRLSLIVSLGFKGLDNIHLPCFKINDGISFSQQVFEILTSVRSPLFDPSIVPRLLKTGRYNPNKMSLQTFRNLTIDDDVPRLILLKDCGFNFLCFPNEVYLESIVNNTGLRIREMLESKGYSSKNSTTFKDIRASITEMLGYVLALVSEVRTTSIMSDHFGNSMTVSSSRIPVCSIGYILSFIRPFSNQDVGSEFENFLKVLLDTFIYRVDLRKERLGFVLSMLDMVISNIDEEEIHEEHHTVDII